MGEVPTWCAAFTSVGNWSHIPPHERNRRFRWLLLPQRRREAEKHLHHRSSFQEMHLPPLRSRASLLCCTRFIAEAQTLARTANSGEKTKRFKCQTAPEAAPGFSAQNIVQIQPLIWSFLRLCETTMALIKPLKCYILEFRWFLAPGLFKLSQENVSDISFQVRVRSRVTNQLTNYAVAHT